MTRLENLALLWAVLAEVPQEGGAGQRQRQQLSVSTPDAGNPLMIVIEYMNLGALDDFLRVSNQSAPWVGKCQGRIFLGSSLFSWGLGLPMLPLGRPT